MNQNFDESLELLLQHEGGFVNDPRDDGGMTNLGVTARVYEEYTGEAATEEVMRNLQPSDVAPLYRKLYWDRLRCTDLPTGVDYFCFDWGVNSGTGRSAKALQRAAGAEPDGSVGPITLMAVDKRLPIDILEDMYRERDAFYRALKNFDVFGKGWIRRNEEAANHAHVMIKRWRDRMPKG